MKELTKCIKQTLRVTIGDIRFMITIPLLGYVMGLATGMACVYMEGSEKGYFYCGTAIALLCVGFVIFAVGLTKMPTGFNMALSMGKVRKHLVAANYIGWICNTLIALLICMAGSMLEECIYRNLYPEAVCELNLRVFLCNPVYSGTLLLCAPALALLVTAFTMRLGANGILILSIMPSIVVLLIGRIVKNPDSFLVRMASEYLEVLLRLVKSPLTYIVLGLICVILAYLMLRKQRVTY